MFITVFTSYFELVSSVRSTYLRTFLGFKLYIQGTFRPVSKTFEAYIFPITTPVDPSLSAIFYSPGTPKQSPEYITGGTIFFRKENN